MKWLPKAEDRLQKMAPLAADIRPVRIQLVELKVRSVVNILAFSLTNYFEVGIGIHN